MLERSLTTNRLTQAIVLAALSLLWATNAQAAEQRCTDLGSGCICSEPFQMTGFSSGPPFWNPTDSTTKECNAEGGTGMAISRNAKDITASTDGPALAALPAGNSVARFMQAGNDHDGIFFAGHGQAVNPSFVRLAARWYIWHTPTFDFKSEGNCDNSKITEHDNNSRIDYVGWFHTYNYLDFSTSFPFKSSDGPDCCVTGPGPNNGLASSEMKGKWWRFEVVMTNRSGPNFDVKMYGKNITDNAPELTLIDLSMNKSVANLTPPSLMSKIVANHYRQAGAGPCRGWIGTSHYMMAGWTTNAGQRIGAAKEVEPGIPTPPTNLKVSQLIEE